MGLDVQAVVDNHQSLGKTRNITKKSIVWEHFTIDLNSPGDFPMTHCNYGGVKYKCHGKKNGTSNILYHIKACQKSKSLKTKQNSFQSKFTFEFGQS